MIKKVLIGITFLSLLTASNNLFAQAAPEPKKEPEKIMLFNGTDFKLQLYGFIKVDGVLNSKNVRHEASPFFVENNYYMKPYSYNPVNGTATAYDALPKTPAQKNGSFVMSARTSRLGLKLSGPEVFFGGKTLGVFEVDFWGQMPASTTAERQGQVMMRHAYIKIDWPTQTYVLAGSTWSLMTPMSAYPDGLDYINFAYAGLMFMREQQVGIGQTVGSKVVNVLFEASIARPQSGSDPGLGTGTPNTSPYNLYPGTNNSQVDEIGSGEATKKPAYKGRITFNINPIDDLTIVLGSAVHYQKEKHALSRTDTVLGFNAKFYTSIGKQVDSQAVLGFAKVSYSLVSVTGQFFTGDNIDTFLCGLGQGVVQAGFGHKYYAVKSRGGFGQASVDLRKVSSIPVSLSAGYGEELKSNKRNIAAGSILWNKSYKANLWVHMNQYVKWGVEVGKMKTKYKSDLGTADNMKYHSALVFTF